MRKIHLLITALLLACASPMCGQGKAPQHSNGNAARPAQRKFQILVKNEDKVAAIRAHNQEMNAAIEASKTKRGLLGDLIWTGVTSAITQKTVNASSNLVSLGISYLTDALKSDREKWYRAAQQQCFYNQQLSAESSIDDFYALPSHKGAMDPENLKFEGFGCKNYIELSDAPGQGTGIFYIFCKMRRDSLGLSHIANHSKFLVEIDTLIVNPKYCNLPNDSTGSVESRFDYAKRDNLNLTLNVKIFSSWINDLAVITENQQLGQFSINVRVDKNKLDKDGLFVYDKNDPDMKRLVSVEGDCFIVPRSYTGTMDGTTGSQTWGTGQYRVEMEVSERCSIVDEYYYKESGNGQAVAFADATPGRYDATTSKHKWDKAKWKVEWTAIKSRRRSNSFWKNAWNCIVQSYKGSDWVATLTDPITTALYSFESTKLSESFVKLKDKLSSDDSGTTPAAAAATPTVVPSAAANATAGGGGGTPPKGNGNPKRP